MPRTTKKTSTVPNTAIKAARVAEVLKEVSGVDTEMDKDGLINFTKWSRHFCKEFKRYRRNKETKEYLEAVTEHLKPSLGANVRLTDFLKTTRGGRNGSTDTWGHYLVAIHFAGWLSPEFQVHVNETFSRVPEMDVNFIKAYIKGQTDQKVIDDLYEAIIRKYLSGYHAIFNTISRAVGSASEEVYRNVNGRLTKTAMGMWPKDIVESREGSSTNARDYMTQAEATRLTFILDQCVAAIEMEKPTTVSEVVATIVDVCASFETYTYKKQKAAKRQPAANVVFDELLDF